MACEVDDEKTPLLVFATKQFGDVLLGLYLGVQVHVHLPELRWEAVGIFEYLLQG